MTDDALQKLLDGNQRFVSGRLASKDFKKQIAKTASGQQPYAAVLTCIDSRVSPEIIFDTGIGDIFTLRVAGNVVNEDVLGSLEYACKVTGSRLIVVMGHTNCGAVKSAIAGVELGNITPLLDKIKPAIEKARNARTAEEELEEMVSHTNVELMIERIRNESTILNQMERKGMIQIVGALYNISNGRVQMATN